jgi:hypothetical protein
MIFKILLELTDKANSAMIKAASEHFVLLKDPAELNDFNPTMQTLVSMSNETAFKDVYVPAIKERPKFLAKQI